MRKVLLVILLLNAHQSINGESFKCNEKGKCIHKTEEPDNNTLYETHNACRLTCGGYGAIWPQPTGATIINNTVVHLNPHNIRFEHQTTNEDDKEYLNDVGGIFLKNIVSECEKKVCYMESENKVVIKYQTTTFDDTLTWDTDESYNLTIATTDHITTVQISSHTAYGARHALTTLEQLITLTRGPSTDYKNILIIVSSAQIEDRPVFRHRGLLIDTSRNYISITDIERTLDRMGASKLNVFHWHATDSQSFPLEIPRVPQMAIFGAYSPNDIYTLSDVQHIIKYAKQRGVQVIIEIDAPSHAGNGWQWGPSRDLGNLSVCVNKQPWRSYCVQPPCGQLNPANLNVYDVLRSIYADLLTSLPAEATLHMGGDEVSFKCWESSKEILDYMKNKGLPQNKDGFLELWAEFQSTNLRVWDEEKRISHKNYSEKPVILWGSHLTDPTLIEKYLSKDRYIIQTWVIQKDGLPKQLLGKGYKLIITTKDAWYFDHGFSGPKRPSYHTWQTVYTSRLPRDRNVLGGEACVWTELIDGNSLDERVWPRAAALAERLWTDSDTDTPSAEPRFFRHRERLVDRGIRAEAVAPKYCVINEGECWY